MNKELKEQYGTITLGKIPEITNQERLRPLKGVIKDSEYKSWEEAGYRVTRIGPSSGNPA